MTALLFAFAAAALTPAAPGIELRAVGEEWQVRYRLARPARRLFFDIPYGDYRQTAWRPADRSVQIVADGQTVRASRRDGQPFTSLSFRLTPRYREVPQNYAPFSPFSDGGLLIFTGQFHACADAPCKTGQSWTVRVSAAGKKLLAGGVSGAGDATFKDSGDGILIYAGTMRPLTTAHVLAVMDPALPSPLRSQLDALLPRLSDYFSRTFGALEKRPMLFASLDRWPRPNSGLSYQGGTLPGQVFLHFYGSDWRRDAAKADFIPWFFAHEIAHFYHGARSGNATTSEDEAWIHEGGAEAFAALALRDLGDAVYVARRVDQALDRCIAGYKRLAGKPLTASADAGAFQNHYDCGMIFQLAIDADLRRSSGGRETLATLWVDFLDRSRAGAPWTAGSFLATARRHGLSDALTKRIAALSEKPQQPSSAELRALMNF